MIASRFRVPCSLVWLAALGCGGGAGQSEGTGTETEAETGTATATDEPTGSAAKYRATIRRTAYGVAHILADDIGSAGFGQAYAFAQDHACVLADQILKVRSERALFHGPGGSGQHLDSDFGYLALDVMTRAEAGLEKQSPEVRALIDGYVAGYNQFLADTGVDNVVGSCGGQAWLRPISSVDLFAYYVDLGLLGSSNALLGYLATAQPPGSGLVRPGGPVSGLNVSLINGDCDGDNTIGTDDYLLLNGAFDTVPGDALFDARADLNGDESVGTDDYLILNAVFDTSGD